MEKIILLDNIDDLAKGDKEEKAYQCIKKAIQTHVYKPGQQISEQKLSEALGGMSRTPVKDALRRLIFEGLIEKKERGMLVSRVSLQDLMELSEVRVWLERGTVRLFIERADGASIAVLGELLEKHKNAYAAGDYILADKYDSDFHLYIAKESYNQFACDVLGRIIEKYTRGTYQLKDNMPLIERSISDHQKIYDAIRDGDAESAVENTQHHLEKCMDYLKEIKMTKYFLFQD